MEMLTSSHQHHHPSSSNININNNLIIVVASELSNLDSDEYLVEVEHVGDQHPTRDADEIRSEVLAVTCIGCVGFVGCFVLFC